MTNLGHLTLVLSRSTIGYGKVFVVTVSGRYNAHFVRYK